jgi:hypothetical protein
MATGGSPGRAGSTGRDGAEIPEDEASRESFPASDPPSTWSGEEFGQPDPPESS